MPEQRYGHIDDVIERNESLVLAQVLSAPDDVWFTDPDSGLKAVFFTINNARFKMTLDVIASRNGMNIRIENIADPLEYWTLDYTGDYGDKSISSIASYRAEAVSQKMNHLIRELSSKKYRSAQTES